MSEKKKSPKDQATDNADKPAAQGELIEHEKPGERPAPTPNPKPPETAGQAPAVVETPVDLNQDIQNTERALKQADVSSEPVGSAFASLSSFDLAQRMARVLSASTLVPKEYQGADKLPNAIIALEMAQRIGASPLAVMQNLYIVHGKPGWSAQFIIASLNSCGRYSPLRFKMTGEMGKSDRTCVAYVIEKATGEVLEGTPVSIGMAIDEGWHGKNGSKWKTMPEQMLRYRAASFFGKLYAPEIMMGMSTADELHDIIEGEIDDGTTGVADINAAVAK